MHGKGTLTKADGSKYRGEFLNGTIPHVAVLTYAD
jgi:hypothetical protein